MRRTLPGTVRTRRCIDPTELLAICEPHEPEAVLLAAAASGDLRRQAKIWIAELPDGEPAGVAGCIRVCFDRWYGASLLLDERGAEPLARVLDRSPAWRIWGAARHVEPLCSWLTRVRHIHEQQGGSFSPGLDETSESP